MRTRTISFIALAVLAGMLVLPVLASTPPAMKVQGYLSDRSGGPSVPADGVYSMQFEIYDAESGGLQMAAVGPLDVTVVDGRYEVDLPVSPDVFDGATRYLQITVSSEVLSPRIRILSTPYAFRADRAATAAGVDHESIDSSSLAPGAVDSSALADGSVTGQKIGVSCAEGEVLIRSGSTWICSPLPTAPLVCQQGSFVLCYEGPPGTLDVGVCQAGHGDCKADGTGFGACTGDVRPTTELCDGLDNDCDGSVDEEEACASPPPTLLAVIPASGSQAGGTNVVLTGQDFQAGGNVTFGGVSALDIAFISSTSIQATTPASPSPGSVNVAVINPDAQSDTLPGAFSYLAPPTLLSVIPASGPQAGGTDVVLTGQDFQDGGNVTFGGISALDIAFISSTTIQARTPASPSLGPVNVAVINPDGYSDTLPGAFTYVAPPTLLAVIPTSGPQAGGTNVILTGQDFQDGGSVFFGGTSALDVVFISSTTIQARTPASPSPGPVNVAVVNPDGHGDTLPGAFSYLAPPTLLSVIPTSGPQAGGTNVVLTGQDFQDGGNVTFGGVSALDIVFISSTTIQATTPASPSPGPVNVAVINPDGQSDTLPGAFSYVVPPTLTSVSPDTGTQAGGTNVILTGQDFQPGTDVTFGGFSALGITVISSTTIQAMTPSSPVTKAVNVTVINQDGQSDTLVGGFTYKAP